MSGSTQFSHDPGSCLLHSTRVVHLTNPSIAAGALSLPGVSYTIFNRTLSLVRYTRSVYGRTIQSAYTLGRAWWSGLHSNRLQLSILTIILVC